NPVFWNPVGNPVLNPLFGSVTFGLNAVPFGKVLPTRSFTPALMPVVPPGTSELLIPGVATPPPPTEGLTNWFPSAALPLIAFGSVITDVLAGAYAVPTAPEFIAA